MTKPTPPCHKQGSPDCSNRRVGCQIHCEKYKEYKDAMAEYNRTINEERLCADYVARRIWANRSHYGNTDAIKKATAQR